MTENETGSSPYAASSTDPAQEQIPTATPVDPYASAAAKAGASGDAADSPGYDAQRTPGPPPSPYSQQQQGYRPPTYAQPDWRRGTYAGEPQQQPPTQGYSYATTPSPQTGAGLSGGLKFGWFLVGMLAGIVGMLVAWLANFDRRQEVRHDAILWSVIGFAARFVAEIALFLSLAGAIVSAMAGIGDTMYYF